MDIKKLIVLVALTCFVAGTKAQNCSVRNKVFKPGESVTYKVYYHWHFVWVESGEVSFNVSECKYHGIPSYYFVGMGHSYPKYDWFYTVRDTFQAYVDTFGYTPLRFTRYSNEGSTHVKNDNQFDDIHHKVYYFTGSRNTDYKRDSINIPACTFDPLSGIYFVRNIDFSKAKINDTVPVTLYLDDKIYHIHIRYMGKETEDTKLGKFRCIKFNVSLISGTIFKEGQEMSVWVTDDNNRVPVYIEAPIIIGSVRAELLSFSNLRNAMDAKVK
jgi:hypothetical protein